MSAYFVPSQDVNFEDSTLVIPSLGIGHCAQLAIDLLINSLEAEKVGYLDDPDIIPVAGNLPDGSITTSTELFWRQQSKLCLLQQRAPVIKNKNHAFAQRLLSWAKAAKFGKVIVLTSIDSARRILPEQFQTPEGTPTVRFFASDSQFHLPGWQPFEGDSFGDAFKRTSFAQRILVESEKVGMMAVVFSVFCAEGFTVPHSIKLAEGVLHLLPEAKQVTWKYPSTWGALFEFSRPDITTLYG